LREFGRPSCWLKLNCCNEFGGKCSVKQGQLKKPVLSALLTSYTQPATITVVFHDGWRYKAAKPPPPPASSPPSKLADLPASTAPLIHLRDGEVVLYRVSRSSRWQARIRLLTPKWIRFSTRQRNQIDAARVACERYDEARYRERLGLAPTLKRFEDIARECIADLRRELAAGTGKRVYTAYIGVIERYFVPFFGQMYLTSLTVKDMLSFEAWRNQEMGRTPRASTLLTFSSALNRIHQTAVARGWISERVPLPKLQGKGQRGKARPAFTEDEIQRMRQHLLDWHLQVTGKTGQMRRLLRDLVDVLVLTGMRQGTESMNLEWRHIAWHEDKGVRYLRIWVSGKTGPRWLIAKHECAEVLQRLHAAQPDIASMSFEAVIAAELSLKVFRLEDGTQPYEFTHVFRRLLGELAMNKSHGALAPSLYSLRHTYATRELLGGMDIHTLARQMGTSVVMLERHYSKLVATMAAERLA
jgi:integrase